MSTATQTLAPAAAAAASAVANGDHKDTKAAATATATATATTLVLPLVLPPRVWPLPWGYDDVTLGVGAVRTAKVVTDATGAPVPLPHVFRELQLRGVTLKNRFGVSPMCMYSCEDGHMSDWHVMHYGKFAALGAGLIIAEMTAVQANGRISPYCSGLWQDSQIAPLKRVADMVHSQWGAKFGVQLAHAGRKASVLPPFMRVDPATLPDGKTKSPSADAIALRGGPHKGWHDDVVAPSALAWDADWIVPKALTVAQIQQIVDDFVAATKRADAAGLDVVELHGAHGYLFHQFFSPLSNKRTDDYGGSFENRIRLLLDVTRAVRAAWPAHKPLFVRLSCTDWVEGGWDLPQTLQLVPRLLALGVDVVDLSSGGNSPLQRITTGPGYQVPYSEAVKQHTPKMVTATVGEITSPAQAEAIVSSGKADFVLIGRQFLAEPNFVLRAADELNAPISWAPQYARGKPVKPKAAPAPATAAAEPAKPQAKA